MAMNINILSIASNRHWVGSGQLWHGSTFFGGGVVALDTLNQQTYTHIAGMSGSYNRAVPWS